MYMNIPFSVEEFMNVFCRYNSDFAYMPVTMYVLGAAVLVLLFRSAPGGNRIISGILAFLWIWMGAVYHLVYFSSINRASLGFGVLVILQGLVFLLFGTLLGRIDFRPVPGFRGAAGTLFLIYALVLYPLLGHLLGHVYPASPLFGMAPCPTTIFTFGLLLLTRGRIPLYVALIPFLWALVGLSAAVNLHIYEDFGLIIAGTTGAVILITGNRKFRTNTSERRQ